MKLSLSLQQNFQAPELVLKRAYLKKVVETSLRHIATQSNCEIGIACVDNAESHQLNLEYRGKDKPTNVLSFPMMTREELLALKPDGGPEMLGDIALARETCVAEAAEKGITLEQHAAHLIVHGLLHLAGHDHVDSDAQAEAMEALEIKALAQMGIADPYGDRDQQESV